MKVLVACEFSGVVRDAFIKRGHNAFSCDILDGNHNGPHLKRDVLEVIDQGWDLMVAHPPCTFLCNSGAKHLYKDMKKENGRNKERWQEMHSASLFFKRLLEAPIPKIAVENPIMLGHAKKIIGMKQTQTIQPWQFGHGEIKATCLWLKNLPSLEPTNIVDGREARVHKMGPSKDRWRKRSVTLQGIADAMASQWGYEDEGVQPA
jgi:hypothetical protein